MSCLEVSLLWARSRLLVEREIRISILNPHPYPNDGYTRVCVCVYTHIYICMYT